jgi:hypothetical protein
LYYNIIRGVSSPINFRRYNKMSEVFNYDGFQIPHVGVPEPDLDSLTRTDAKTTIRRPLDMKISNFGALAVGARMGATTDYTRVNLGFKAKGESEDVNVITADTGVGQGVRLNSISVNYNPHIWGNSIKYVRDDQFIRMTMARNTGTSAAAVEVDAPKFDVMDSKNSTAAGINAATNANTKNWPSEGWRSFGGKYDFLPYAGGVLK